MISVLILTYNEELILPGCLAALSWCDDVVIYDSYSTDRTRDIARTYGARLVQRPCQDLSVAFGGDEGYHRSWGLREISFVHPWVLVLDADESIAPDALNEIYRVITPQSGSPTLPSLDQPVAYELRRRDFYQGRHLKHVQATHLYIRVFRPSKVRYERLVNPVIVVDGDVASLNASIDHYPFSKGLSHWIARHNTYSTLEARQILESRICSLPHVLLRSFYAPYSHTRRYYQKRLFYLLPMRPLIKFAWLYFLKLGFLDRGPGFCYAVLQAIYEFFIVLKVRELQRNVSSTGSAPF